MFESKLLIVMFMTFFNFFGIKYGSWGNMSSIDDIRW